MCGRGWAGVSFVVGDERRTDGELMGRQEVGLTFIRLTPAVETLSGVMFTVPVPGRAKRL